MKKTAMLAYWIMATLLIAGLLVSLNYSFAQSMIIGCAFLPGAILLDFFMPRVSFAIIRQGVINMCFLIIAIILLQTLLVILINIFFLRISHIESIGIDIPDVLVNPIFIGTITASFASGSYLLRRHLYKNAPEERQTITFTSNRQKITVDECTITYIESNDTEVWIHTADGGNYRNKTSITQWENYLGLGFVRIHRSYLVNKRHITAVGSDSVTVGNENLPISRKYQSATKTLF